MQERTTITRNKVLDAARRLFLERSVAEVSVQEIAAASGVSNGSIFHHFGSKNGIILEIYLVERRRYWEHVFAALVDHDGHPADALGAAARASLDYQTKYANEHTFMIDCGSAAWMRPQSDQVKAFNEEFGALFATWIAPHLEAGRLSPVFGELYAAMVFGPSQYLARSWM